MHHFAILLSFFSKQYDAVVYRGLITYSTPEFYHQDIDLSYVSILNMTYLHVLISSCRLLLNPTKQPGSPLILVIARCLSVVISSYINNFRLSDNYSTLIAQYQLVPGTESSVIYNRTKPKSVIYMYVIISVHLSVSSRLRGLLVPAQREPVTS